MAAIIIIPNSKFVKPGLVMELIIIKHLTLTFKVLHLIITKNFVGFVIIKL